MGIHILILILVGNIYTTTGVCRSWTYNPETLKNVLPIFKKVYEKRGSKYYPLPTFLKLKKGHKQFPPSLFIFPPLTILCHIYGICSNFNPLWFLKLCMSGVENSIIFKQIMWYTTQRIYKIIENSIKRQSVYFKKRTVPR